MPELPEVETIARQLAPRLVGVRIGEIQIERPDLLRESPKSFKAGLEREEFVGVTRRGKNLVFRITGPQVLLVNLGMTGQFLHQSAGGSPQPPPHRGLTFHLLPEGRLHYADVRRFGRILRLSPSEWDRESRRLGPEPLDSRLTGEFLLERTSKSRSPIRSWLLDQTRLAGIGNIYANEALFRAGVHPARPANSLSRIEVSRLLQSVRGVLEEAIRARGTTLRDYRTAEGSEGNFGPRLQVYGREGSPCPVCGASVVRFVLSNRSTFFCPKCQQEDPPSES
jgi:formamidopyrimidine-DNA glycosylase